MNEEEFDRKLIAEHGTFSVELVASGRYDEDARLPAHDKVLRPLLQASTECWAYGVRPGQGPASGCAGEAPGQLG